MTGTQILQKKPFEEDFEKRELIPAMPSRHGKDLTETHNNGSHPIDEIFVFQKR